MNMKKLNVQRDLDSRARMAETPILPVLPEPIVEPINANAHAESQESKECTDDQSTPWRKGKRRKEDGRPRGTFKRYKFEETKLGFMLKYETPVVYGILMNTLIWTSSQEPSTELIEVVCRASRDSSFKKPKFRRYLKEYARYGLYCHRPKRMTPELETYYAHIRKVKKDKFIYRNREKIGLIKKAL